MVGPDCGGIKKITYGTLASWIEPYSGTKASITNDLTVDLSVSSN